MNENENPSTVRVDRQTFIRLCQEANYNRRPLARHLFSVAKYLGIGAMIHAWFLGPRFETDDLWSWAYLVAWPIPLTGWLLAKLGMFFLYCLIVSVICTLIWWAAVEIAERRGRRFRQPPRSWDARQ